METLKQPVNKSAQNYTDFIGIVDSNGWKVYVAELEKLYQNQVNYMENLELTGDQLKYHQLIKRGLKLALNIPKVLEISAKIARKEKR